MTALHDKRGLVDDPELRSPIVEMSEEMKSHKNLFKIGDRVIYPKSIKPLPIEKSFFDEDLKCWMYGLIGISGVFGESELSMEKSLEEMIRPRIYVAGAYSGPDIMNILGNMRRGLDLSTEVLKAGFAPFSPWTDFQFSMVKDGISLQDYYEFSLSWLMSAEAVIVVPEGAEESKGTQLELAVAKDRGLPIFWDLEELKAHFGKKTKELVQTKHGLLEFRDKIPRQEKKSDNQWNYLEIPNSWVE